MNSQCDYCLNPVPEEASVCSHCGRDLYLIKKLRAEFESALANRISEKDTGALQTQIKELQETLAALEKDRAQQSPPLAAILMLFLFQFVVPVALLCAAHALVVYVYEWSELYLHVMAIFIPFAFTFTHFRKHNPLLLPWLVVAVMLAGSAVLLMSAFTAAIDSIPVFPQSPVEWRDLIAFFSSIASSHIAGMVMGRLWFVATRRIKAEQNQKRIRQLLGQVVNNGLNPKSISDLASALEELATKLGAIAAAAVSLYAGLRSFF